MTKVTKRFVQNLSLLERITVHNDFYRVIPCICAAYAVMQCLPVCVFVCPSRSWIMSKQIKISSKIFHHRIEPPF